MTRLRLLFPAQEVRSLFPWAFGGCLTGFVWSSPGFAWSSPERFVDPVWWLIALVFSVVSAVVTTMIAVGLRALVKADG